MANRVQLAVYAGGRVLLCSRRGTDMTSAFPRDLGGSPGAAAGGHRAGWRAGGVGAGPAGVDGGWSGGAVLQVVERALSRGRAVVAEVHGAGHHRGRDRRGHRVPHRAPHAAGPLRPGGPPAVRQPQHHPAPGRRPSPGRPTGPTAPRTSADRLDVLGRLGNTSSPPPTRATGGTERTVEEWAAGRVPATQGGGHISVPQAQVEPSHRGYRCVLRSGRRSRPDRKEFVLAGQEYSPRSARCRMSRSRPDGVSSESSWSMMMVSSVGWARTWAP